MGEIAEDMKSGACCSWCGCYFVVKNMSGQHVCAQFGKPCVCKSCFKQWRNENRWGKKWAMKKLKHLGLSLHTIDT